MKPAIKKGYCNYSLKPGYFESCLRESALFVLQIGFEKTDKAYLCKNCFEKATNEIKPEPETKAFTNEEIQEILKEDTQEEKPVKVKIKRHKEALRYYTNEEDRFLRKFAYTVSWQELDKRYYEYFNKIRGVVRLKTRCKQLGIIKPDKENVRDKQFYKSNFTNYKNFIKCIKKILSDVLPDEAKIYFIDEIVKDALRETA